MTTHEISLAEKIAFLAKPSAYTGFTGTVTVHETHMSCIFLAGKFAYKLKKPVCFSYLDFSSLEKREKACRAELYLNQRLAPGVYLRVLPLCQSSSGDLVIDGPGPVVDWLVAMRRLDDELMLEHLIMAGKAPPVGQIVRLGKILSAFYRKTIRPAIPPAKYRTLWLENLRNNRLILSNSRFGLSKSVVLRIDTAQRRFLAERGNDLTARLRQGFVVEGHGDLRAEHVWLGDPITIFDCLEFNKQLRCVDPSDEVAQLSVECDRLNVGWIGRRIRAELGRGGMDASDVLFCFFRCYRATLKARLLLAHLLEPHPRTPRKWRPLALAYLQIADKEARRLQRYLRAPAGPPSEGRYRCDGWRRPEVRRWTISGSC